MLGVVIAGHLQACAGMLHTSSVPLVSCWSTPACEAVSRVALCTVGPAPRQSPRTPASRTIADSASATSRTHERGGDESPCAAWSLELVPESRKLQTWDSDMGCFVTSRRSASLTLASSLHANFEKVERIRDYGADST